MAGPCDDVTVDCYRGRSNHQNTSSNKNMVRRRHHRRPQPRVLAIIIIIMTFAWDGLWKNSSAIHHGPKPTFVA
jgi:hypothetical protein